MEDHDEQDRPDDASDLFGYAPRKRVICPSCARVAEPYSGMFCWKCTMNGDAGRKLSHPTTTEAEQDRWSGLSESIRSDPMTSESV